MTKTAKRTLIGILVAGTAIYGGIWLYYYISSQEANQKGVEIACEENRKLQFEGTITDIEKYEQDSFMNGKFFSFRIETKDTAVKSIYYQYGLPENKELLDFIEIGQIAEKQMGSDKFRLTVGNKSRLFTIEKCDMLNKE